MRSQSVAPLLIIAENGLTENGEQKGNMYIETAFEEMRHGIWIVTNKTIC
jgi:hypothetical protein